MNVLVKTAIGYVILGDFDEIRHPLNWDSLDDLHLDLKTFDELRTRLNGFEGIDELRSKENAFGEATEAQNDTEITIKADAIQKTLEQIGDKAISEDIELTDTQKADLKEICDEDFLEYLIYAYTDGVDAVNEMLTSDVETKEDGMFLSIDHKTADLTAMERLNQHIDNNELRQLQRTTESEMHRVYNDAILTTGIEAGAEYKTWETMEDDKVRDTHQYLEGMKIPINEKFYTYDGDSALYPSGFESAENNTNCRCRIHLSR